MINRLLLLLLVALVVPSLADTNRCGAIQDDRSIYTKMDPSNGHNVLEVKITATNKASGYSWDDIVKDTDKYDEFNPFIYCNVSIGGGALIDAEVERRGDWARESELPSIKVKFSKKGVDYKGMDRLLLNKSPHDITRVRSKISYELMQDIPNMSSLFTQFVHLYVNDKSYGIYTLIEDLRDDMMKGHGLKKSSNLYKSNQVSWDLNEDIGVKEVTDPKYNEEQFTEFWDIRGADNHTILINAYKAIMNPNSDSRAVMEGNFNVDNFATWLAFVILTGNNDLVFNNFGIYAPKESDTCKWPTPLYMMAWDNDGAWHYAGEEDKDVIGVTYPLYEAGIQQFWSLRSVKRFLMVDAFVDMLESKMDWLVHNALSYAKVKSLTDAYKPILQPFIKSEPDASNLFSGLQFNDWVHYIDQMPSTPTHLRKMHEFFKQRPMPVQAFYKFTKDHSSLLFFWGKSFTLKNKYPFFYHIQVATDKAFKSIKFDAKTTNTYVSLAASKFKAKTTYYWRLYIRNSKTPNVHFMMAYMRLTDEADYGISTFKTPATIGKLAAPKTTTITHKTSIKDKGKEYYYATLNNLNPTSKTSVQCSGSAFSVPKGWKFAPNAASVRSHLRKLALPWAGANLVLADGARVSTSGVFLDVFGTIAQHLEEKTVIGGKAYSANCTSSIHNHILLYRN